jgi:hypothetical protein
MVDAIIAADAFVLHIFVAMGALVLVATGQQLSVVNLNAIHAVATPLVLVKDVRKKFVLHVSTALIRNNVVALTIDKMYRTNFFLFTYETFI